MKVIRVYCHTPENPMRVTHYADGRCEDFVQQVQRPAEIKGSEQYESPQR